MIGPGGEYADSLAIHLGGHQACKACRGMNSLLLLSLSAKCKTMNAFFEVKYTKNLLGEPQE